jgi:hypothetical protein
MFEHFWESEDLGSVMLPVFTAAVTLAKAFLTVVTKKCLLMSVKA